jgi:hypothetical protein
MIRCINDGVTTIKTGLQDNLWSDESSLTLFPNQEECAFEEHQGNLQSGMHGSNSETQGRFCDDFGSNIVVQYSLGSIIILHGHITAREYLGRLSNQVHPMIQKLFPNNDAVFQDDNVPIHTAGTVQSWFEEHEGELQHLPWPAQSPHLNITEPVCGQFWRLRRGTGSHLQHL